MVIATPGAMLLPSGVRVITGVVGAEFATVKVISVQSEYSPHASFADPHGMVPGIVAVSVLPEYSRFTASPSDRSLADIHRSLRPCGSVTAALPVLVRRVVGDGDVLGVAECPARAVGRAGGQT